MKFNLRMIFIMLQVVVFSFFALILPYEIYSYILRYISAILFIAAIMSIFRIFNMKLFFISKISNIMYNFMVYSKLYGTNEKYNKINFFYSIVISLILFLISFIDKEIFKNIFIGIFSSSLVSVFIYYFSYSYEKYKFYNTMICTLEKAKCIIEAMIQEANYYGAVNTTDKLEEIDLRVSGVVKFYNELYQSALNIAMTIGIYDDTSIMSMNTIENLHAKKITNKKIKEISITLLSAGINMNKINTLKNIQIFIMDIFQHNKEMLEFNSLIKDMRIAILKQQTGYEDKHSMDFQKMMDKFDIKLKEYNKTCEELKKYKDLCDKLQNDFMIQFK